ncbi:MAG: sugar phosphate nucleotidyltransferase, partial [Armatimonadota bacterium]
RMMRICREERPEAMLAVNRVDDPWEGAAVYVEDDCVDRIIEKPPKGASTTNFNNAGLFVFGPELLQILKGTDVSERGELEVPSAIGTLLERGTRIRAYEIDGYWSDVARPSSAIAVSGRIIERMSHSGIIIHPEARLAASTNFNPPVMIGPGASVGNATVGPNAVVMANVRIGDGAALADTILLPGAEIGPRCELTWTVVEEGAVVAANSTSLGTDAEAATIGGS